MALGPSMNIRLVEIQRDGPTAKMSCKLHVVPLAEKSRYVALSYVWGDASSTQEMMLDGKPILIRQNLRNFLHEARDTGFEKLLWIDALSIDQDNIQERNHQVAMMGDIYSSATFVLVWFGLGSDTMGRAMSQLTKINHHHTGPANWTIFSKNIKTLCTAEY